MKEESWTQAELNNLKWMYGCNPMFKILDVISNKTEIEIREKAKEIRQKELDDQKCPHCNK